MPRATTITVRIAAEHVEAIQSLRREASKAAGVEITDSAIVNRLVRERLAEIAIADAQERRSRAEIDTMFAKLPPTSGG